MNSVAKKTAIDNECWKNVEQCSRAEQSTHRLEYMWKWNLLSVLRIGFFERFLIFGVFYNCHSKWSRVFIFFMGFFVWLCGLPMYSCMKCNWIFNLLNSRPNQRKSSIHRRMRVHSHSFHTNRLSIGKRLSTERQKKVSVEASRFNNKPNRNWNQTILKWMCRCQLKYNSGLYDNFSEIVTKMWCQFHKTFLFHFTIYYEHKHIIVNVSCIALFQQHLYGHSEKTAI